jgi:hypothetical protein
MKFLTTKQAQKLKAGNTVYRCQINHLGKVNIEVIHLKGKKVIHSFTNGWTSVKVGKNFLDDLVQVPCFSRRKDAVYFQKNINDSQFTTQRLDAIAHWEDVSSFSLY